MAHIATQDLGVSCAAVDTQLVEAFHVGVGLLLDLGAIVLRLVLREGASALGADLALRRIFFQEAHHAKVRQLVGDDSLEVRLHPEELLGVKRLFESNVDLLVV